MNHDLSDGKFYASWPDWLRWALFLPSAIIGCLICSTGFNILAGVFGQDNAPHSIQHGWYNLISSAILGWAFVAIAAYVAPKKQFEVSIFMLALLSLLIGMLWVTGYYMHYYVRTQDTLYYIANYAIVVIAGAITVFSVKTELERYK